MNDVSQLLLQAKFAILPLLLVLQKWVPLSLLAWFLSFMLTLQILQVSVICNIPQY